DIAFLLPTPRAPILFSFFSFTPTATTDIYTLSLHDALPILTYRSCSSHIRDRVRAALSGWSYPRTCRVPCTTSRISSSHRSALRSEEHTSELQSPYDLVCRLLLEKKKKNKKKEQHHNEESIY